jgi:hypothetical protein
MTPVARRHIKVEAANTMNWLWLAFHRVRIVLVSVSRGLLLASRQIRWWSSMGLSRLQVKLYLSFTELRIA